MLCHMNNYNSQFCGINLHPELFIPRSYNDKIAGFLLTTYIISRFFKEFFWVSAFGTPVNFGCVAHLYILSTGSKKPFSVCHKHLSCFYTALHIQHTNAVTKWMKSPLLIVQKVQGSDTTMLNKERLLRT